MTIHDFLKTCPEDYGNTKCELIFCKFVAITGYAKIKANSGKGVLIAKCIILLLFVVEWYCLAQLLM
jgi:hypothetical protein